MRRSVIVVILFALAFVLIVVPSLFTNPMTSEIAPEQALEPESQIIRPTDGESGFWPYLNSQPTFEERSPINIVVVGNTEDVLRVLSETDETRWERMDGDQQEADPDTHALVGDDETQLSASTTEDSLTVGATAIAWTRTTGATRYAYVDPGDGTDGRWITETIQLHDGTYYGHRYHIRLYESPNPDESWVAIQTHSEHFDWFTLRHRVDGSQAAQVHLETDLRELPQVDVQEDISRVYLGNRNASDADGWATFVTLLGMVVAGVVVPVSKTKYIPDSITTGIASHIQETDRQRLATIQERVERRQVLLAGTVVAVVLGVRIGGIALERTGYLSMHSIAALLYPVIGIGLPLVTYLLASGLERRLDAAVVAGGSLAVAIWLDYGFVGVDTLPIDVIVQRVLLVVALGLIAAGAPQGSTRVSRWTDLLTVGTALWVVLLVGVLLGYI